MSDEKNGTEPRRRRWPRRVLVAAVVLLALYTLLGFFGVPWFVRKVVLPRVAEGLNGDMTVQRARFNPFTFAFSLEQLEIVGDGGRPVLDLDRFDGNFSLLDTVTRRGWHLQDAELTKPRVRVEIDEQGIINLARLARPATGPSSGMPLLIVGGIEVRDAGVSVRDLSRQEPFEIDLVGLTCTIDGLRTEAGVANPLLLEAQTEDGERLRWEGSFQVEPISSRGTLTVTDFRLPRIMPYVLARIDARIVSGRVAATVAYDLDPVGTPRKALVEVREAVTTELSVEQAAEPWLDIVELTVRGISADLDARRLEVESLVVSGPTMRTSRNEQGDFRIMSILKQRADKEASGAAAGAAPRVDPRSIERPGEQIAVALQQLLADAFGSWSAETRSVGIDGGSVIFADRSRSAPLDLTASGLALTAGPVRSEDGWSVPLELAASIGDGGRLELSGTCGIIGRTVDLRVRATGMALAAFGPYLPEPLPEPLPSASLREAGLDLDGTLRGTFGIGAALAASWSGSARLDGVRFDDADGGRLLEVSSVRLVGDAELSREGDEVLALDWSGTGGVNGLSFEGPLAGPVTASAEELAIEGTTSVRASGTSTTLVFAGGATLANATLEAPETIVRRVAASRAVLDQVEVDTAGRRATAGRAVLREPQLVMEVPILAVDDGASGTPASAPADEAADVAFALAIDELTAEEGSLELRDERRDPPAVVTVSGLSVQASRLSTQGGTAATLDVSSNLQGSGRFEVAGTIDAFAERPSADLVLRVTTLPLEPLDPLAASYAGYHVDSGRLALELPLKIEQGALSGTLDVDFDGLKLGANAPSSAAPNVPIKLGLELLRDANDRIEMSLPLHGDVTEPGFDFGGLVWQAFLNVLLQATTAPFKIIGGIFGAGEEDLSYVSFEPGSAAIVDDALSKIDVLGRALDERPAFSLRVTGRYAPDADVPALQRLRLKQQLLAEARSHRPDVTSLSDLEYRRAIDAAYEQLPGDARTAVMTFEQKEAAVVAAVEIPVEGLVELAGARALAVVEAIVRDHGIDRGRLELVEPTEENAAADEPRADFELR